MKAKLPYQITVAWSPEDEAYVARVPALRYCVATGDTPEKAVKEVKAAAGEVLRIMKEDGKPAPAVDATLAHMQALQPLINLSAVAKAAGLNVQTLSSKVSRGTALNPDESNRIGQVLALHGLIMGNICVPDSLSRDASSPLDATEVAKTIRKRLTTAASSLLSRRPLRSASSALAASPLSTRPVSKAAKSRV